MQFDELKNILQKLTNLKITQSDIADALQTRPSTINSRIKRGTEFKSFELDKIEKHFKVSLNGQNNNDVVLIDKIGINPSCGTGTSVYDDAEIVPVKLGREFIREILKITNEKNLKIFKASGDSMSPTIEDCDMLLVDIGRCDFANGGIFLMTVNNEWYIKRLNLKFSGELEIISDNPKYEKQILLADTQKEVEIRGRVIKNLSRGL